jgi:Dockerin type I domain
VALKTAREYPQTGQPVADLRGFLPPDINSPEGEGSISFTVTPKHSLSTGVKISNTATVFFDGQPLPTKPWLNTIDNTAPVSSIQALPSQENSANFTIEWQGSDEGSGVQDFTIYVSRDGGTFVPWLINTTALQSTYTAQPGHNYSFYSVGRDAAGNVEAMKTAAEATTTVQAGILGDVNGDSKVDCADIAIVKAGFGTTAGDPKFDVRADVNEDNAIDVRDLAFVAQRIPFGLHCGN